MLMRAVAAAACEAMGLRLYGARPADLPGPATEREALLRLWKAFESGMPGLYWSRIWAMYILLWWCREHKVGL